MCDDDNLNTASTTETTVSIQAAKMHSKHQAKLWQLELWGGGAAINDFLFVWTSQSSIYMCSKLRTFRCLHQRCKTNTTFHVAHRFCATPAKLPCLTRNHCLGDRNHFLEVLQQFVGWRATILLQALQPFFGTSATIRWNPAKICCGHATMFWKICNNALGGLQLFCPQNAFFKIKNKTVK